ncbi:SDR family oxidoreductase [Nocardia blacklockiae]|uniref:SDR family oxidoreductase n=1 Tax=Nocardia blacklockiae TaxID=480036 RepID=UPI001893BE35|nr:SDR family oxidoreductase [Nocardia blacklockiae]MBF6176812.1 SDR family oxidoreductase [Nocardia blacklockiae]
MKSVLVTGAGRGIGLAVTQRLSRRGWQVYAGVRRPEDEAVFRGMAEVVPVRLDITDPGDLARLPQVLPAHLDGVVNNAGIAVQGPLETVTSEQLTSQLEVNVVGQLAVTRAVLPLLRAGHGRIVFISSLSGRFSAPGMGAYCASKFALEALGDALRVELRPWQIPVSLIEPGTTATDLWADATGQFESMVEALPPEQARLYERQLAGTRALLPRLQRLAVPADKVAAAVEHALSARRPKRRYLCDTASRAQMWATAVTPTAVLDAVLSAAVHRG